MDLLLRWLSQGNREKIHIAFFVAAPNAPNRTGVGKKAAGFGKMFANDVLNKNVSFGFSNRGSLFSSSAAAANQKLRRMISFHP